MSYNKDGVNYEYNEFESLLRQNTAMYIAKVFNETETGTFKSNWHIDYMAEYMDALWDDEIQRLVINVPPGYTKSVAMNIAFTTRTLGKFPDKRILAASHSSGLALQFSNKAKSVITSDWYKSLYPGTVLKTDSENTQSYYKTTKNGYRRAISVSGKLTGDSADLVVIDDPTDASDANKAASPELIKVNDWYDNTLYSRVRDKKKGQIVLIMQRLNENDLSQHLLDGKLDKYEHCIIPAIEEHRNGKLYEIRNYRYFRKEGELLCPHRDDDIEMAKNKERLGTLGFTTQYQQNPIPKEGGLVELPWFKRYSKDPKEVLFHADQIIQSWDTASKTEEMHDYTVCTTWAVEENQFSLLHVLRKKMEYPLLKETMIAHAEAWESDAILIEDKASGQALIQDIRNETTLPIVAITPVVNKIIRFSAQTAKIEAGCVSLPKKADWLETFEHEMLIFPNGRNDDQCDSLSQFLMYAAKKKNHFQVRQL